MSHRTAKWQLNEQNSWNEQRFYWLLARSGATLT